MFGDDFCENDLYIDNKCKVIASHYHHGTYNKCAMRPKVTSPLGYRSDE